MPFAIENGVRHLEWRTVNDGELTLLEQWRRAGGQTFSLHYSSLGIDESGIIGTEKFTKYSEDAIRAGADLVTVHPPHVANEIMTRTDAFNALADAMAECLLPVAEKGINILVENNF